MINNLNLNTKIGITSLICQSTALTMLSLLSFTTSSSAQQSIYMGKASTGEAVYYQGARFQCGDLPKSDECWWRTPAVSYTIGKDSVFAIADCKTKVFQEVWVGERLITRNMRPQSEAIRLVLANACRPQ